MGSAIELFVFDSRSSRYVRKSSSRQFLASGLRYYGYRECCLFIEKRVSYNSSYGFLWLSPSSSLQTNIVRTGVSNDSVSFSETEMHFQGMSEGRYFEAHLEFYKPIVPEKCQWQNHPLGVEIYIEKKKEQEEGEENEKFWPHLLKDKSLEKLNTVSITSNTY
jgi:hypothetical protein